MDALQIVKRAEGPAIATDKRSRILGWNEAAQELFENNRETEVVGQALHSLLDARDVFGNRLDFEQMPFLDMVTRGEPIRGFEIEARKHSGEPIRLVVSVVVVVGQPQTDFELVYLLRPVLRRRRADEAIERVLANRENEVDLLRRTGDKGENEIPDLTRRQMDVLRLLAQGYGNEEIAERLFLSIFTVRNHVQAILEKLGVHSKVEAVSRAFRDNLV